MNHIMDFMGYETTPCILKKSSKIIHKKKRQQDRGERTQLLPTGRGTPSRDLSAEHQDRMKAVTLSEAAHVYGLPLANVPYTAVFSPLPCATRTGSAIFNAGDPCFVSSKISFKFSVIDIASSSSPSEVQKRKPKGPSKHDGLSLLWSRIATP